MKLELKHVIPHLEHNLKVLVDYGYEKKIDYVESLSVHPDKLITLTDGGDWYFDDEENDFSIKLALRPLSDLTKEITVNGEAFVPMYKLFELEYKGTSHFEDVRKIYCREVGRFIECSHYGTALSTSVNVLHIKHNNYWKVEKLIEWHFDINNLIEKGLAVNINDLNK